MAGQPHLPLVAIVGPTACGKSRLALDLANALPLEIINCDSLQFYRGLDIGTAKTPPGERGSIPHHLFDILEPHQVFNAGDFAAAAKPILRAISSRRRVPLLVGGTGFYLRALLEGLADGPRRDEQLRTRLAARDQQRPGSLHRLLSRLDPATATRIHANDKNKLIRALEICLIARRPATAIFRQGRLPLEGYRPLKIGLDPPRPLLVKRIESRTAAMFSVGLVEELRSLLATGIPPTAKAFESIGYRQALGFLQGRMTLEEAVLSTTMATRQYAKRQLTWFRRESGLWWIHDFGDSVEARTQAAAMIREHLASCTFSG